MPVGKDTYLGANEMRESLLAILKDVSPNEDNYFVSNLGKGPSATNTLHEWDLFYASRPTSVTASPEGKTTVYTDLPAETRSNNKTTILEEAVRVTRTKASIAMVTGEDAVGKEKERASKRLKANMEWITINGAYAAGSSGVARQLSGIDQCISSNVTARASGTSFTEDELNDMIQQSWDAVGSDYVANMVAAPVIIKRRVSKFGTNLTRTVDASEKKLTQEVRVYDSQVGPTVMVIAHKDIRAAAGTLTVYALNDSCFEHSFLIDSGEPHWEDRAKDGDYVNGVYITEFTLVSYAEKASVKRTGYATTL